MVKNLVASFGLALCALTAGCLSTSDEDRIYLRNPEYKTTALEREALGAERFASGAFLPIYYPLTGSFEILTDPNEPLGTRIFCTPIVACIAVVPTGLTAPFQVAGGLLEMLTCSQFKGMAYPSEFRNACKHFNKGLNESAERSRQRQAEQVQHVQPRQQVFFNPQPTQVLTGRSLDQQIEDLLRDIYTNPILTPQQIEQSNLQHYQTMSSENDWVRTLCEQTERDACKIVSGDYTQEDVDRWEREARVWTSIANQAEARTQGQSMYYRTVQRQTLDAADNEYRSVTGKDFDADSPPRQGTEARERWEDCNRIHQIYEATE